MADIAIFRINYKSDFILTLNSDAGWATPFCIKFWTGAPSQAFFVGWDGTTYTHCAPVAGEPTKLTVQFDDHHLPIGNLKFQIAYHFTVADFPTSVEDEVINQASAIIEVDDAPAQVMLDFNGETAPEIEFSLPAYANEAQRIANEEQRIAHEAIRIVNEESRIAAETTRQQNETQRINNEAQRIRNEEARIAEFAQIKADAIGATGAANSAAALANEKAQLAADKAALADEKAQLAADKAALAQSAATLATEKAQLATDKAALAQSAATLANDKAALAQQKAEYATAQGDYAKAQGDYAKAQAGVIPTDVTRTQTDATFVNSNHDPLFYLRQANSSLAGLMTAAGYTKLNDMPAAQEVNAGLAYDVSVLHPTSGVSGGSTYASLSAAIAVIPQDKRKGGMTVKFVQSSDNKYVQYRLMATSFSTTVADWQGVDEEPTAGSENMIKSGGVYDAFNNINHNVNGTFTKELQWTKGYINKYGVVKSSSSSQFSQPFLLKAGEKITIGTTRPDITIIGSTVQNSITYDDTISVIQTTTSISQFETYSYTASEDIKIVVCVLASDYTIAFENTKSINAILSNIDAVPTKNSNNLVKSGGVKGELNTLSQFVGKDKNIVFFSAYVNATSGLVSSSSLCQTSQPFALYKGESVTVTTKTNNIGVICRVNSSDGIEVGDLVEVLERTTSAETETHTYTATEDIWVVISFFTAGHSVSVDTVSVDSKFSNLKDKFPFFDDGIGDVTIEDSKRNIIVSFRNGHIKTKNFDSSKEPFNSDAIADFSLCDPKDNKLVELKRGHIKTSKFNSEDILSNISHISKYLHEYISAEQYNQISVDKCKYEKLCHFPTSAVYKGKFSREYEIGNYTARIALFGDLHIGYGYSFKDTTQHIWKNWEDYVELSIKRASNKVPDFGIALGDMLSAINKNLYERNGVGLVERNDYYNRLRTFNYPLFNVFGNHDEAIPEFTHTGVVEINNIRFIVFHMDIIHNPAFSTYNISDKDFDWLENAVKDSYNNNYITILVSHYPIIGIVCEPPTRPDNYFGELLVNNHGQDLIDLCKNYDVRMHIHGHCHSTGFPYRIMNDNGVPFDMTQVEIGLGARAYVILEVRNDGFHFTEYPVTNFLGQETEDGIIVSTYESIEDNSGRTLFVPFYGQQDGTVRSEAPTPYPGIEN